MAFTVITQPVKHQPVNNKLTHVVLSTEVAQPLFKYVFDLYVNGVLVNTSKLYPRPDATAIYDPSYILKSYLESGVYNEISAWSISNTNELASYYVVFKEEFVYNAVLTTYTRSTTSTKYVWNAVADWEGAKSLSTFADQFLPASANNSSTTAAKPLGAKQYYTRTPGSTFNVSPNECYKIGSTEKRVISIMPRNNALSYKTDRLTVYTVLRVPVGSVTYKVYNLNLTTALTDEGRYQIYHMPIGVAQLNAISWTSKTIPTGRSNSINIDEDSHYLITFANSTSGLTHRPLMFEIDDCTRYDRYTVMYKTEAGGWWYTPMNMKSTRTEEVNKSTMNSVLRSNYDYTDRVTKVLSVNANGSYVLNTDWISSQNIVSELMELFKSPIVYIIDSTGKYIPVVVKGSEYIYKNISQDKMVQYTVEFSEAFTKNTLL